MSEKLPAIEGGAAVRSLPLPYAQPSIGERERSAVAEVLATTFLTTGPRVASFERSFAAYVGAEQAVAFASGTAALHGAMFAAGVEAGDEVAVSSLSFAASANAALYQGADVVFADVDPAHLDSGRDEVERVLSPRTRALVAVDFAGHPLPHAGLVELAVERDLVLIEDACQAAGAISAGGRRVGSIAPLTCFSLHAVKPIAAGEGGVVTTSDANYADRMRRFRNHCMDSDSRERAQRGSFFYDVVALGYNYRLSDLHCALAEAQLVEAEQRLERRCAIAERYAREFGDFGLCQAVLPRAGTRSAWHLFVVQLALERLQCGRARVFEALRAEGITCGVHYRPIHLHSLYRERFGTAPGLCPVAEAAYEWILSLPVFSGMSDQDADDVIAAVRKVLTYYRT